MAIVDGQIAFAEDVFAALNAKLDLTLTSPQTMTGNLIGNFAVPVRSLGTITAATLSIDVTTHRVNTMTLAHNLASFAITTTLSGAIMISTLIAIVQDSTGSRTIVWPDNFLWQGGFSPSLSTAPGATDVIQALSINGGTTWFVAVAFQVPAP
jgi:hypothetical protein